MNLNVILAILENKGVISRDEAEAVAEYIASKPQQTYYKDAVHDIEAVFKQLEVDRELAEENAKKDTVLSKVEKLTDGANK